MHGLRRRLPALAAAGLCAIVLFPLLDYASRIAQGDHGRDLYAGAAMLRGELPYRDYIWQYGPLAPFWFGLAFATFGTHAKALLWASALLKAATATMIHAYLARTTHWAIALLGCWWYLLFQREFPHTFAHTLSLTALMALALAMLHGVETRSWRPFAIGCAVIGVLLLSKLNFGLVGGAALVGISAWSALGLEPAQRRRQWIAVGAGLGITTVVAGFVYLMLLRDVPGYELRQNLPFLPGDHLETETVSRGLETMVGFLARSLVQGPHAPVGLALTLAGIVCWLRAGGASRGRDTAATRALGVTALFALAALHELAVSGIPYRMLWAGPFVTLAVFGFANEVVRALRPRAGQALLAGLCVFCVVTTAQRFVQSSSLPAADFALDHERLQLRTTNRMLWKRVVLTTADLLDQHVPAEDVFVALPYDPLYYFLTDRASPIRELALAEYMDIPAEQEQALIERLDSAPVDWVVLSSRAWASTESGIGRLGETYLVELGAYLDQHFALFAQIGEANAKAYWIDGHAVRIYRRVPRLPPTG